MDIRLDQNDDNPVDSLAGRRLSRRTALRGASATGLALASGAAITGNAAATQATPVNATPESAQAQPNILIFLVDQMRDWQWFPDRDVLDEDFPAMARLQDGAIRFRRHYCSSAMCTPSRGSLMTGLYTHQTGLVLTIGGNAETFTGGGEDEATPATPAPESPPYPVFDARFPTWGTLLRQQGYDTYWYGKWHANPDSCDMEQYGFHGGTCPSPDGAPGEGNVSDPMIAGQAIEWLQNHEHDTPWCTTVSLVNPHDIQYYPKWTEQLEDQANPPSVITSMPENYETAVDLLRGGKPLLQEASMLALAEVFGDIPHRGPGFEQAWLKMLDLYYLLHGYLDNAIGSVLDALEAQPEVAANTIIVFTSDHGDHCGSHGMRGKGACVYEEGIRVPLWVKDPTGRFASQPEQDRTQITSAVDIVPMLLTMATGNTNWTEDPDLAYLANRFDITSVMQDAAAPGREYALHTTDEDGFQFGPVMPPRLKNAPFHVMGVITNDAKLGVYTHWENDSTEIVQDGQQFEYYDYATEEGRLEIANIAGADNPEFTALYHKLISDLAPNELRAPLPDVLEAARKDTMDATVIRYAYDRASS